MKHWKHWENGRSPMELESDRSGGSIPTPVAAGFFVALCLALAFSARSALAQTPANAPLPHRPSIIFILADDLGYGDLGCYGQTRIKTPNLDNLASNGMRFTSFYAGSTVCAPSRATLMTGYHTGHVRIRGNLDIPLRPEDVTVAEVLKGAGYRTAAFGKWGLGDEGSTGVPSRKGFEEWFGYLNQVDAHNYYPVFLNRTDRQGNTRRVELNDNLDNRKGSYADDLFTQAGMNYLRQNQPTRYNQFRPVFLYLPYTIPHANDELGQKTGNGMEVPSDDPYAKESWPQVEKNKAAMITRLDGYAGLLMDHLKQLHLDTNTVVIFTSDNGAHKEGGVDPRFFKSAGPLRGIKRDLYEGGIRVPLIVWWPGRVKAGAVSDLPCAFWDFPATLEAVAGLKPRAAGDGLSFLPTLLGETQTNLHEFLYWEFHEGGFKQAVRMGDWKAVRYGVDGPLELYNLREDLGEKRDVAGQHPEITARILEYLKTARTEDKNWPAKTAAQTSKREYGR